LIQMNECHVFVIDDDEAVRRSLCWLIESADHNATGFVNADEFLMNFSFAGIGCVVTDVRMPGISGIDLLSELTGRGCDFPVIVITAHGEIQMAVEAMKLGAFDFVEKPFEERTLLEVIERALLKHAQTLSISSSDEKTRQRFDSLTPRELEVLDLIIAGNPNRAVAEVLGISDKTVEAHRAHIMDKMGVGSFAELIALAVRADISAGPRPLKD